jgi:pilus assembly protein Flp/PilA
MNMIKKLIRNSKGATAIEYGLIAALIAVAGIAAFSQVGAGVSGTFGNAAAKL